MFRRMITSDREIAISRKYGHRDMQGGSCINELNWHADSRCGNYVNH
jgi:hypothetical protein